MSTYLVLIYDDVTRVQESGEAAIADTYEQHRAFAEKHGAALRGGHELAGGDTATSIRHGADGGVTVSDGVFVESKDILGGYYVVEADDLDAALKIARDVPAPFGGVEVRPVVG